MAVKKAQETQKQDLCRLLAKIKAKREELDADEKQAKAILVTIMTVGEVEVVDLNGAGKFGVKKVSKKELPLTKENIEVFEAALGADIYPPRAPSVTNVRAAAKAKGFDLVPYEQEKPPAIEVSKL